jgi:serine phosphatase RsbU (regulator of sigma subunit)
MKSLKLNVIGIFFALLLGVEIIFLFQLFGIFPQDLYGVIPEVLNNFLLPIVIFLLTISGYSLVRMSYIQPVRQLRTEIAMFLAWAKTGAQQQTERFNPDLSYVGNFFYRSLDILRNFKDEFKSGRVLRSEVELAADIQKHVLKKEYPKVPTLEIIADTKSASEVGGDSYDIIKEGPNTYIYIWDVTGHGVASGFVMMVVNALISGFSKMVENSALILSKTNEILKPRVKSNMLMTLLMVRWNEDTRKLYMSGAGHEYLLVYKKAQNRVYALKSGGVALGMMRDISKLLKEVQISFEPGDCIILYTDGITEARNGPRESDMMFGIERLKSIIEAAPQKTASGIFNAVTIELSKFMWYAHKQFDDITLIVVRYKEDDEEVLTAQPIPVANITEWNWH